MAKTKKSKESNKSGFSAAHKKEQAGKKLTLTERNILARERAKPQQADRYYKFVVNNREYVEALPESADAPLGHIPISQQEFQQRLPYNQMEEQEFRRRAAVGQLPFTGGERLIPGDIAETPKSGIDNFRFNTGDPEFDSFLNDQFLPAFKAQFASDPLALFNALNNPKTLQAAIDRVGKTFGSMFEKAKGRIEQNFTLQQESLGLRRREQLAGITGREEELGVQKTRTLESAELARKREARNFQTAVQESSAAFASAGRAFGGGRQEAERRLTEESQEQKSDIQRAEEQRLQDLSRQGQLLGQERGFLEEQLGPQGISQRGADIERGRELEELEGERTLMGREEVERLRGLAGTLLQNPEFRSLI